jgi:hypothetical protein
MELKSIDPNSGNIITSNLIDIEFYFFENCENWVKKQTLYVFFSIRCHDCLENKILHIIFHKSTLNELELLPIAMDYSTRKKNSMIFWKLFCCTCSCPDDLKRMLKAA